ncbi:MAG: MucR family transcriptional regulator, partial [Desulfovibrionaceae bacterium]|nr:MucR family transcriptional regulator [Desulfovibrionaceae bacterium]
EEAIQDDKILCCICGKERQALTEKHLMSHNGLTREGYLKLCGYEPGQALMSKAHLNKMKSNVLKAQQARKTGKTSPKTGGTRETGAESA